jgi:ABC-type amino acid transport substrate-binding protein
MKIIIKFFLIIMGFVFFSGVCFWAWRSSDRRSNTFVVGMMSGWAPFMVVNAQGEFEGFDVDVAREISNRMGKTLEIKDLGSLASLLMSLQQRTIDVALSGLDITESRLEQLQMIRYTGEDINTFYLLFWKNIPEGIKSIQDLKNKPGVTICVEPGSSQEKFLDSYSFIIQKSLSKIEEMILDVQYSKSLAALVEPHVAKRIMRQNSDVRALEIIIPKKFQTFGMGIACAKSNITCASRINSIIKNMRADGTLRILEKNGG